MKQFALFVTTKQSAYNFSGLPRRGRGKIFFACFAREPGPLINIFVILTLFTMCTALHDRQAWPECMLRYRDATERWWHDQVGRRPLPNRTKFIFFSKSDLINDDSSFCAQILLRNLLLLSVIVSDIFLHVVIREVVAMLQRWVKFSNVLVHWCITMVHVKNYETMSKFVKVLAIEYCRLFFPDTVCSLSNIIETYGLFGCLAQFWVFWPAFSECCTEPYLMQFNIVYVTYPNDVKLHQFINNL